MAKSVTPNDPYSKLKQINKKTQHSCQKSRSSMIDVFILIAVIVACIVLLYPYAKAISNKTLQLTDEITDIFIEEFHQTAYVFICLGLSVMSALTALAAVALFPDRRCGKPGCRGLKAGAEFDIRLETEDCVTKESSLLTKDGIFESARDHHRELEAELKKMAPVNGRAVLVFRARCGCCVGRMEVFGARKSRKVNKK